MILIANPDHLIGILTILGRIWLLRVYAMHGSKPKMMMILARQSQRVIGGLQKVNHAISTLKEKISVACCADVDSVVYIMLAYHK